MEGSSSQKTLLRTDLRGSKLSTFRSSETENGVPTQKGEQKKLEEQKEGFQPEKTVPTRGRGETF